MVTVAQRATVRGRSLDVPVAAILLLALVVRVAVVLSDPHFVPLNDAAIYDASGVSLAKHGNFPQSFITFHGGPTAYHPPFFSGLLAIVYTIVGTGAEHSRWEDGRLMEAVLGTIAVWLVVVIGTRLFSRRLGLTAGAITAVWPPLILIGSSLLSEAAFVPLVLGATWAALRYRDDRALRWAALAGVLLGCATLTRGNGFALLVPVGFLLWSERPRRSWRTLRAPAVMLAAMVIVLVPWTIRNEGQFHELVPVTTETGFTIEGTYNATQQHSKRFPAFWNTPLQKIYDMYKADPTENEAQMSDHLNHDAASYAWHHPGSIAKTFWWNTLRLFGLTPSLESYLAHPEGYPHWLTMLSDYAFWPLGLLALAGLCLPAARRAPWALWGVPLAIFLSTVFIIGIQRYRAPADPFLILAAALALLAGWDRSRGIAAAPSMNDS